ncbi:hypothetical protein [Microvirga ossetica]|nr:hypothetical protein [Microvirga ossetica]
MQLMDYRRKDDYAARIEELMKLVEVNAAEANRIEQDMRFRGGGARDMRSAAMNLAEAVSCMAAQIRSLQGHDDKAA